MEFCDKIRFEDDGHAEEVAEYVADELDLDEGWIDSSAYYDSYSILDVVLGWKFPEMRIQGSTVALYGLNYNEFESAAEDLEDLEFEDIETRLSASYDH